MQLTADEVLRTFHHDYVAFFLGSAFATIGLIAIAVLLIRRKFDAMLFWLGLFAILYGSRLWTQSGLLALMVPPSDFFDRLRAAGNFIVAIPALFLFSRCRLSGTLRQPGGLRARRCAGYRAVAYLCWRSLASAL